MTNERLIRPKDAAHRLGVSTRTLYREVSAGNIPAPLKISERTSAWRESTILQIISDRAKGQMSTAAVAVVVSEKRGPGRPRKLPVTDGTNGTDPRGAA
ncbi:MULTISPECIES: helix-turn-helix transcriptional regulator [Rhizobium]|uniref:helix-turn-helix transcriptional regulator n=1 Tax=Rhizobium TaxID=379 RepID=UPI001030C713|nr:MULTISPECIES: AlpA family phage regulatory protein [Rhizobium]QIO64848.1 hypothetical protein HA462_07250 [Rhizobium leguminosarum bv. trifolii]TBC98993.1 hypothetical protein ELH25_10075 [Rhizobium ruizarguesonis]TBE32873.1 hypothetical protein ELH07_09505 [Rhizobium ruizarguesonis]